MQSDVLSIIDTINEQVSMIDLFETEFGIKPTSNMDYSVSCPLHADKSPSHRIYAGGDRGSFCYSCGRSYTPYSLMKAYTGDSTWETIKFFEEQYGVDLSRVVQSDYELDNKDVSIYVNQIRKYATPNLLDLESKAIALVFREGKTKPIENLAIRVLEIKGETSLI